MTEPAVQKEEEVRRAITVVRVELNTGEGENVVHEIPLMSPLYSVLVGREIFQNDHDRGETYENRCAAVHKWLLANDCKDVDEDFMKFLTKAEMILMYLGDVPLEGPERELTLVPKDQQDNSPESSSMEISDGTNS